MTLASSALNYVDNLPISLDAVQQAIRDARDNVVRAIRKPHQWQVLKEVARTKSKSESDEFLQLLGNLMILEYRDDDGPWYDVNPVVREAREFRE
jgi:hypothetical protein